MLQRCLFFFAEPAKAIIVNTGMAVGSAVVGTVVFHSTQEIGRTINSMSTENSANLPNTTESLHTTEEQNNFPTMS